MGMIKVLDCTLRDGGYVNGFSFDKDTVKNYLSFIDKTNVEYCELGFLRPGVKDSYESNIYSGTRYVNGLIENKSDHMKYVVMVDMSDPVSPDMIEEYNNCGIDSVRVIFKKNRIEEGARYCSELINKGYEVFAQLVGTDKYSDQEFIQTISVFNQLKPYCLSIVDTFGVLEKKQFLRYVHLADNNLNPEIALGYHGHNNLNQAMGNAMEMLSLNLKRDVIIDGCIMGIGRGAGNLNLELFSERLNEEYGKNYCVEPMFEIMEKYLDEIYNTLFIGYSIPMYMSAKADAHPNYAVYFYQKGNLNVNDYKCILESIPEQKRSVYSEEDAEFYYKKYINRK